MGIDLLIGIGPVPKLDVAIVRHQEMIGVLDARLRLHVVGHDDRIARDIDRRQVLLTLRREALDPAG